MEKLFLPFVLLVWWVSFANPVQASDNISSGEKIPHKTVILRPIKTSGRPNAPSNVNIECTYGMRFISFVFPEGIDSGKVEIFKNEEYFADYVTYSTPHLGIPALIGTFTILLTTDDDRVFQGTLFF